MQSPLRILRISQKLTLSHVAGAVDIDPGNLSRIERGQQMASLDVAERLVKFYRGSINELQILYPYRYVDSSDEGVRKEPQSKGVTRG